MSRSNLKEIDETLDEGEAALIVTGEQRAGGRGGDRARQEGHEGGG